MTRFWPVALLVGARLLVFADAAAAQPRPWAPVMEGALRAGDSHVYAVAAAAGDLITGTIEFSETAPFGTVTIEVHEADGRKLRDAPVFDKGGAVAFVAPRRGTYHMTIAARSGGHSYRMRMQQLPVPSRMAEADRIAAKPKIESPRMSQLMRDVVSGNTAAVERFWTEVAQHGSPLIEELAGTDRQVLATVVWRAIYDTRNVRVSWPYGVSEDSFMSHVDGTDVWDQTVRVDRSSRFSYSIAPNYRSTDPRFGGTGQYDPLNRRSSVTRGSSILEAPGAPDETWVRTAAAVEGSVTSHRLDSAILKGRRELMVYTPPGYAPSRGPYPLVILFDGPAYARRPASTAAGDGWEMTIGAPAAMDNLIAARRIRPAVVVMVGYSPDGARSELDLPVYPDVIAKELLPWIRSRYAVSANSRDVVIGGYSAGGTVGARTAMRYPALFGNVLMQSAVPRPPQSLIGGPSAGLRFYYDQGIYEDGIWGNAGRPGELPYATAMQIPQTVNSRRSRDVAEAKGYDVIYRETGGDHDDNHWRGTLAEALIALLGPPDA